jgi:ABC-type branched-subunit amino acid transport system substrate-binding protein
LAPAGPAERVSQYDVYAAAATEVLLNAIARSDGTRTSVVSALGTTHLATSAIGPITLDRRGEPTVATASLVRIERGGATDVDSVEGAAPVRAISLPAGGS